MRTLFYSVLIALFPWLANRGEAIIENPLHFEKLGDFHVGCAQYSTDETLTSWDGVPKTCLISIYPERPEFSHLGSIEIYPDRVDFNLYRDSNAASFGGYSIEQRGEVIWQLPPAALKQRGNNTPISGAERAAFINAMSKAARKRGTLRLQFKVAYSDAAPVDLEIPLRKWTAALRDMRRTTKRLGEPTTPWGGK